VQYQNGMRALPTSLMMSKSYTANFSTSAQSFQADALFSPIWRPCSGPATIVLSYLIQLAKELPEIWNGGFLSYSAPSSIDQSQRQSSFVMSGHSLALELVSPSSSLADGGHGDSFLDGKPYMDSGTSDGQKLLALSVLSATSSVLAQLAVTSPFMVTTRESSRDGGMAEAGTNLSMMYSNASIPSSELMTQSIPSIPSTFPVSLTRQMPHQGGSIPQQVSCSHLSSYQPNSTNFSSTPNSLSIQQSSSYFTWDITPQLQPNPSTMLTGGLRRACNSAIPILSNNSLTITSNGVTNLQQRYGAELPISTSKAKPRPYRAGLIPVISALHPHCLAWDRLRLWCPSSSRSSHSNSISLSDSDLDHILSVINVSWTQGTRKTYSAGLLVYHVFCDTHNISEELRCPATPLLNYIFGICVWHILHGIPWTMDDMQVKAALKGAAALAPPSLKRPKQAPFTISLLESLFSKLDPNVPLDTAVRACLAIFFFTLARCGEFTVPSIDAFDPSIHVKCSNVREEQCHTSK
jgi:hypothetical protein